MHRLAACLTAVLVTALQRRSMPMGLDQFDPRATEVPVRGIAHGSSAMNKHPGWHRERVRIDMSNRSGHDCSEWSVSAGDRFEWATEPVWSVLNEHFGGVANLSSRGHTRPVDFAAPGQCRVGGKPDPSAVSIKRNGTLPNGAIRSRTWQRFLRLTTVR